ncbi:hypothetical protein NKH77_01350 [Streptomyces sp. M19]
MGPPRRADRGPGRRGRGADVARRRHPVHHRAGLALFDVARSTGTASVVTAALAPATLAAEPADAPPLLRDLVRPPPSVARPSSGRTPRRCGAGWPGSTRASRRPGSCRWCVATSRPYSAMPPPRTSRRAPVSSNSAWTR